MVRRLNRNHSPLLVTALPWATIIAGSVLSSLPVVAGIPIVPPLGLLMLLAWRMVRPGLLPIWAGLPLGLVEDLFSGQPLGFAILFFSLAMLAIEWSETRFPWRGFWQDWMTAAVLLTLYTGAAVVFSGAPLGTILLLTMLPQLLLSILLFPISARVVALLDRLRLIRMRSLR